MNAGTVTNIDLNAIWRDFDKRYKESTYNVMTSVFTHIPCESGKKTEQDLVMVLNEESRILAYGQLLNNEPFSILTSSALSNHRVAARHETQRGAGGHLRVREGGAGALQRQLRLPGRLARLPDQ